MQTVQTENEKIVDDYPFKFSVSETPNGPRKIVVEVRRFNDGEFSANDEQFIQLILDDCGKWEAFVGTASTILSELDVVQASNANYIPEYSVGTFDFEKEKGLADSQLRRYHMHMTSEERHRREAMEIPRPTSMEVATQLGNVKKWRSLVQTVKLLQSLAPTPTE